MKKQRGFTLIELMFVVAIIAILASISVPLYQDLMSKTQLHTAYQSVSTLKVPASLKVLKGEEIQNASDLGWITGNTSLFLNDPTITTDSVSGNISLVVILDGSVNPAAKGVKMTLLRDNTGSWTCSIENTNQTWKDHFSPKACNVL